MSKFEGSEPHDAEVYQLFPAKHAGELKVARRGIVFLGQKSLELVQQSRLLFMPVYDGPTDGGYLVTHETASFAVPGAGTFVYRRGMLPSTSRSDPRHPNTDPACLDILQLEDTSYYRVGTRNFRVSYFDGHSPTQLTEKTPAMISDFGHLLEHIEASLNQPE